MGPPDPAPKAPDRIAKYILNADVARFLIRYVCGLLAGAEPPVR